MSLYMLINVLVFSFPFALSFDRRVAFYRQWRAVFPAIAIVGTFYIVEDILATAAGSWSFAPEWVGPHRLFGLPIGEWIFFITVPYACIFIYACVRGYVRERWLRFPRFLSWVAAAAGVLMAWFHRDQNYTKIVLILFSVTGLLLGALRPDLLSSFHFWMALALSYGMFLLVNGVLTAVPVVLYNPSAIWGFRLITIPLEDVFYNFSLLTLNFMIFRIFLDAGSKDSETPLGRRWRRSNPAVGEYAGPGGFGIRHRAVFRLSLHGAPGWRLRPALSGPVSAGSPRRSGWPTRAGRLPFSTSGGAWAARRVK